ncbi:uncharacterized protein [Lepeophtheirus salmonis]|uniref:uncharacterized protein isoform X2 n=1 Tax=Lepeophtheirus salmonis TaxID=72036 RepID=UPI001AEAE36F|nr:uncharacterized protein LOC121132310 isoform X2 [Lepeophtheirus salmonis]XP_040583639.1 uncharacterized protein LOC121132310 isoform X2 [Lepeophtheirus salmonis]
MEKQKDLRRENIVLSDSLSRVRRSDVVRCGISESICKWTCRIGGHSSGFCSPGPDGGSDCICSDEDLDKYLCGGDVDPDIAGYTCAGFCQAKGKQSGNCNSVLNECICTSETLEFDHINCISNEVCSVYCQYKEKKPHGRCEGINKWECKCFSNTGLGDIID